MYPMNTKCCDEDNAFIICFIVTTTNNPQVSKRNDELFDVMSRIGNGTQKAKGEESKQSDN